MKRPARQVLRKILIAYQNVGGTSGRECMAGILKYVNSGHAWNMQFLQYSDVLTPSLVHNAIRDGFEGIITEVPESPRCQEALARAPIPIVFTNFPAGTRHTRFPNAVFLHMDDAAIAKTAAKHLANIGVFACFAFVNDFKPQRWNLLRQQGFINAAARFGIETRCFNRPSGDGREADQDRMKHWLEQLPKPAAIMACCDYSAVRVLEACKSVHLTVPSQVSVIGVDNDEMLCQNSSPTLSSVHPDHEELGRRAAEELDNLLNGKKPGRQIVIPGGGTVVERESTRFLPPASALVRRALAFIDSNASAGITVSDVVRHLGVSRRLADLRFRQIKGCTILDSICRARTDVIKRRLAETDDKIWQIAADCGFSSPERLAHFFRKHADTSMRDWRKRHRT